MSSSAAPSAMTADLCSLVRSIIEAVVSCAGPNQLYSTVLQYHGPEPWGNPPVPWPASVDLQPLPAYTQFRETAAEALDAGEAILRPVPGGFICAGLYKPVYRVPIAWPGTPSLTTTEPLLPGTCGWLHLLGKNHGLCLSTGTPDVPEMAPNPLRLSDSVFEPTFLSGALSLLAGPSAQPQPGALPQIGGRDLSSETVHIRKLPMGWILGGTVALGGLGGLPVNRTGDTLIPAATLIAVVSALIAAAATGAPTIVPPWDGNLGTTGPGSGNTTSL